MAHLTVNPDTGGGDSRSQQPVHQTRNKVDKLDLLNSLKTAMAVVKPTVNMEPHKRSIHFTDEAAVVVFEGGSALLPIVLPISGRAIDLKRLTSTVGALDDGEVEASGSDTSLALGDSGGAVASIQTEASDITAGDAELGHLAYVTSLHDTEPTVTVRASALAEAISRVGYCQSSDEARPNLNGVNLELRGETVWATTTDGHRLATCALLATTANLEEGNRKIIIPTPVARAVKLLSGRVAVTARSLVSTKFGEPGTISAAFFPDFEFPDIYQALPSFSEFKNTIHFDDVNAAIKAIMKVVKLCPPGTVSIKASSSAIEIASSDDGVFFTSRNGTDSATVPLVCDVRSWSTVALSHKYLLETLKLADKTAVLSSTGDALAPLRLVLDEREDEIHVIMPCRV